MYFTAAEINTGSAGDSSAILYKRSLKAALGQAAPLAENVDDEEKQASTPVPQTGAGTPMEKTVVAAPTMTDTFSWQHINYTIPLSGGRHKQLLDDVSGYVAPGKLTALMGATGAGKVNIGPSCGK